jgi:5-(carboxyamino)imidazole ribonucleotide mutase
MAADRVVVIMGSGSDEEFAKPIWATLQQYGVPCERRVISAHKRAKELLDAMEGYEKSGENIVYITVAGRSNALSGIVDGNTKHAVIACPPYSEKFGGADMYSSLRMASGIAPLVILEPENAALAAIKILAYGNPKLYEKITQYRKAMVDKNREDDERVRKPSR